MRTFDYSFLFNGNLPGALINIIADIYSLRTMSGERKDNFSDIFSELERVAIVQSVKSSNAIEGIVTTDMRIQEIVNGSSAPLNHSEEEIAGYRDALSLIHTEYRNLDFKESDILRLHALMESVALNSFAGKYKDVDNNIIEVDQYGYRKARFRPISAEDTPKAIEQLVLAYEDARSNPNINQLLLIPCVILDFLCIHPFMDGNGRMSRLLSLLLLYKNGFDAGRYISFEEQINKRKGGYYDALKKSSELWHEGQNDYSAFIIEFLTTLYMCYKELDKRFAVIGSRKVTKEARIEATVMNALTPISKSDISKILPDISATTVEAVLGKMVKEGQISKVGTGRSTRYIKKVN